MGIGVLSIYLCVRFGSIYNVCINTLIVHYYKIMTIKTFKY